MTEEKKTTPSTVQAKSNAGTPSWNAAPLDSRSLASAYVDTSAKQNNIPLNASKNKRD